MTKSCNFLANAIVLPLLAEKIDAANMLGIEISEICKRLHIIKTTKTKLGNQRPKGQVKWNNLHQEWNRWKV